MGYVPHDPQAFWRNLKDWGNALAQAESRRVARNRRKAAQRKARR